MLESGSMLEVRIGGIDWQMDDRHAAYFALLERAELAGRDPRAALRETYPDKRTKDVDAIMFRWEELRNGRA